MGWVGGCRLHRVKVRRGDRGVLCMYLQVILKPIAYFQENTLRKLHKNMTTYLGPERRVDGNNVKSFLSPTVGSWILGSVKL
ncbi:hypothetical protein HanRHA438_Chr13g0578891 [Helianthus annuus]|nr:hypothetical protein HanRHA438_Chr13g0578891 [Helianthus annuus]